MFGLAQVNAAEVAVGEHHAFGPQSVQVIVAKIVLDEFPFCPNGFGFRHAISRVPTGGRSAHTR